MIIKFCFFYLALHPFICTFPGSTACFPCAYIFRGHFLTHLNCPEGRIQIISCPRLLKSDSLFLYKTTSIA